MHDGQMFNKSFGEFASLMTSTEPEHSGKVYYIDEYVFAATDPALIAKDWVKPSFLTTILKSKSIAISIWAKFRLRISRGDLNIMDQLKNIFVFFLV